MRAKQWAAGLLIDATDELVGVVLQRLIDEQDKRASCLDRAMLFVGAASLVLAAMMPLPGLLMLLTAMVVGQAGWLLAAYRKRKLQKLVDRLRASREVRASDIVGKTPWRRNNAGAAKQ